MIVFKTRFCRFAIGAEICVNKRFGCIKAYIVNRAASFVGEVVRSHVGNIKVENNCLVVARIHFGVAFGLVAQRIVAHQAIRAIVHNFFGSGSGFFVKSVLKSDARFQSECAPTVDTTHIFTETAFCWKYFCSPIEVVEDVLDYFFAFCAWNICFFGRDYMLNPGHIAPESSEEEINIGTKCFCFTTK